MSDGTKIEWAANADGTPGATWNPIVGCSVLSPGCTNCYAMREAARNERQLDSIGKESPYAGLTQPSKAGPVWNGKLRLVEQALSRPLSWKKPRTVFVNSMGDLFHDDVPDEWIDRVFAVMALCPQHTFIVLTKRSARMREYLNLSGVKDSVVTALEKMRAEVRRRIDEAPPRRVATADDVIAHNAFAVQFNLEHNYAPWPLPNVWLGVSAEDQRRANERIPDLLETPAAIRLVSAEPLLGPVDFAVGNWLREIEADDNGPIHHPLDWIIAGGESGHGARPMHPDWPRQIRDQCEQWGVPFFFKQWGAWKEHDHDLDGPYVYEVEAESDEAHATLNGCKHPGWITRSGRFFAREADITENARLVDRVGKHAAGRILDGRTHDERPPLACEAAS